MSLVKTERIGAQEPRIRVEGNYKLEKWMFADGEDATNLVKEYGFELDPWQELVLNDWLARDKNDAPLYLTCVLSCPRQNGKNGVLEAFELYKLVICGESILHTAHLVSTAKKSFERLARIFTDNEDLAELVVSIRRTNGEQGIYLKNGACIEYASRSRGGSRGATYSVVVMDEAQELTDEQIEAIMPTLAASPTGYRQIIYTGTPPGPTSPGTVFGKVRESALKRESNTICMHEWSIEKLPPTNTKFLDLIDAVYDTNPAMGLRLDLEFTENEFNSMSLEGFCRERLGYWAPTVGVNTVISAALWSKAAIDAIANKYRKKTALAVKFSPDGSEYCLAGAKMNAKGESAVELIEFGSTSQGTKALAQALYDRRQTVSAVVVDGMSGASTLCDNLFELKAPRGYVITPNTSEIIAASTGLLDGLKDGSVKHTEQEDLTDSALGSTKRLIGKRGGWGFESTETHDATPIEAVSLALWCVKNTKRNPKRKQRLL